MFNRVENQSVRGFLRYESAVITLPAATYTEDLDPYDAFAIGGRWTLQTPAGTTLMTPMTDDLDSYHSISDVLIGDNLVIMKIQDVYVKANGALHRLMQYAEAAEHFSL